MDTSADSTGGGLISSFHAMGGGGDDPSLTPSPPSKDPSPSSKDPSLWRVVPATGPQPQYYFNISDRGNPVWELPPGLRADQVRPARQSPAKATTGHHPTISSSPLSKASLSMNTTASTTMTAAATPSKPHSHPVPTLVLSDTLPLGSSSPASPHRGERGGASPSGAPRPNQATLPSSPPRTCSYCGCKGPGEWLAWHVVACALTSASSKGGGSPMLPPLTPPSAAAAGVDVSHTLAFKRLLSSERIRRATTGLASPTSALAAAGLGGGGGGGDGGGGGGGGAPAGEGVFTNLNVSAVALAMDDEHFAPASPGRPEDDDGVAWGSESKAGTHHAHAHAHAPSNTSNSTLLTSALVEVSKVGIVEASRTVLKAPPANHHHFLSAMGAATPASPIAHPSRGVASGVPPVDEEEEEGEEEEGGLIHATAISAPSPRPAVSPSPNASRPTYRVVGGAPAAAPAAVAEGGAALKGPTGKPTARVLVNELDEESPTPPTALAYNNYLVRGGGLKGGLLNKVVEERTMEEEGDEEGEKVGGGDRSAMETSSGAANHLSSSISGGEAGGGVDERQPCGDCGRLFSPSSLAVHSRVCKNVFGAGAKRSPFPTWVKRVEGTPAAYTQRVDKAPACQNCGKKLSLINNVRLHLQTCAPKEQPPSSAPGAGAGSAKGREKGVYSQQQQRRGAAAAAAGSQLPTGVSTLVYEDGSSTVVPTPTLSSSSMFSPALAYLEPQNYPAGHQQYRPSSLPLSSLRPQRQQHHSGTTPYNPQPPSPPRSHSAAVAGEARASPPPTPPPQSALASLKRKLAAGKGGKSSSSLANQQHQHQPAPSQPHGSDSPFFSPQLTLGDPAYVVPSPSPLPVINATRKGGSGSGGGGGVGGGGGGGGVAAPSSPPPLPPSRLRQPGSGGSMGSTIPSSSPTHASASFLMEEGQGQQQRGEVAFSPPEEEQEEVAFHALRQKAVAAVAKALFVSPNPHPAPRSPTQDALARKLSLAFKASSSPEDPTIKFSRVTAPLFG